VRVTGLALLLLLAVERPCFAWGRTAHEIIGFIAETQLTPEARSGVRRLLHGASISDGDVACWADELVKHLPESGRWHYVNIPFGMGNYMEERDCPTGDCVVARLEDYRKVLADKTQSDMKRGDALKFVVHLVADAQQPLHCVDADDRGGNEVEIVSGKHKGSNLHQYWDSGLLDDDMGPRSLRTFEKQLLRDLTPALKKQLTSGNLREWINQCHAHGEIIFDKLKVRGGHEEITLPANYVRNAAPDMELDLERAGLRLAVFLNAALAGEKVTRAPPPSHHSHRRRHRR
jgi:hypothetical protein